jgi:hypothetical protein
LVLQSSADSFLRHFNAEEGYDLCPSNFDQTVCLHLSSRVSHVQWHENCSAQDGMQDAVGAHTKFER